jgi:hypothetical protein
MKKVIRPAVREIVEYRSDFSGKKFPHGIPPVSIQIDFGYGSRHDETSVSFELTAEEADEVLGFLRSKLCAASVASLRKKLK